jgi:hypothetical protein
MDSFIYFNLYGFMDVRMYVNVYISMFIELATMYIFTYVCMPIIRHRRSTLPIYGYPARCQPLGLR